MAITYLKKAIKTPETDEDDTRKVVQKMLITIERDGEEAAWEYGKALDSYQGEIIVGADALAEAKAKIPQRLKDDIRYAHDHVSTFARKQRESHVEFETELSPGVFAGQRLIPVMTAGAYVPGGRYAHVASAIMSIATAKAAGVEHVVACSAPRGEEGIHPGILYTMDLCGADTILALGGVQGIAAMAFGLFTGRPADILVGPGNRFVAEAKRVLFGRIGIDVIAGPTESMVAADDTADPAIVAADLA
ncbi:MAG: histidinol dehydrogenase, partial [Rhodospirillales bacterium]|nr:histidinol dehydrogenase [Rhodospirillales bacterium]